MSVSAHIAAQRTDHGVAHAVSCRALGVAPSTFYKWRDRPPTPARRRRAELAVGRYEDLGQWLVDQGIGSDAAEEVVSITKATVPCTAASSIRRPINASSLRTLRASTSAPADVTTQA